MSEVWRIRVVEEAKSWLGTPYHRLAARKGVGADCALFPLAVYVAVGLADQPGPDELRYVHDWHLHRTQELYLPWCEKIGYEIERERLGPGDFAIWKFGHTFSHGAIVIDPPQIIHATILGRSVHWSDMDRDDDLPGRPAKFFTPRRV